jgi:tRNA dimethylallyltransferase
MQKLLVIGGATASGKSALALQLAREFKSRGLAAEILCADSITVYRGFEIGAAKPSAEEREEFPHHLLDLADPEQNFTAADFVTHAAPIIDKLLAEEKVPILAGGSGFYLRALLRGMAGSEERQEQSAALKLQIEERGKREGFALLHSELLRRDPGSAAAVHPNDHYRIVRALQAMELHGKPWSELNAAARSTPTRYPFQFFRVELPKEELKARVISRTEQMLEAGLINEVESLLARGVPMTTKPMQSVGYKESLEFLRGDFPRHELSRKITAATMKLAKSQNTWFKGEELSEPLPEPHWEHLLGQIFIVRG